MPEQDPVLQQVEKMLVTMLKNNIPQLIQEGVHKRTVTENKIVLEAVEISEASELYSDRNEFFDGWMPLNMNCRRNFDFTSSQLKMVRDASRVMCATNEIARNGIRHYRNFIVGEGLSVTIIPFDFEADPKKLTKIAKNPLVKKMYSNWRQFCAENRFHLRSLDWQERVDYDGEMFLRVFPQSKKAVPKARFVDPWYIDGGTQNLESFGVNYKNNDIEDITGYNYTGIESGEKEVTIPYDRMIHDKRNVNFEAPRGIPSFWPMFANLRRLEKLLINTSVLSAIHSAIAFVRTFDGASQARVQALLNRERDNVPRTNTITGRETSAKTVAPGTILNASTGMKYEFPAHNVDPSKWIAVMDKEISHIAAGRMLPLDWMLAKEPTEPLTPGSPVIANFKAERSIMAEHVKRLFFMVQGFMGMDVDKLKEDFDIIVSGPRLAVGKSIDESRVDDLNLKNGATSPQAIARKNGERWEIVRSEVMQHRDTAMPGEVMPGDSGKTDPQGSGAGDNGGDGLSKKNNKGQRSSDAGTGGK